MRVKRLRHIYTNNTNNTKPLQWFKTRLNYHFIIQSKTDLYYPNPLVVPNNMLIK